MHSIIQLVSLVVVLFALSLLGIPNTQSEK